MEKYQAEMLAAASNYCVITGRSRSTIATKVMNDGKFFDRIESGSGCTMKTYEKVMTWFKQNTPPEHSKPRPSNHARPAAVNSA